MKFEHLCSNFSYFVLLVLCCNQALGNLFSQKPALTLTLWLPGRPGPESWCAWWRSFLPLPFVPSRFQGMATGDSPVFWLPWRSSLEALKWVRNLTRSWLEVCLLFLLFSADTSLWMLWAWPLSMCVTLWPLARSSPWGPPWCRPSPAPNVSALHPSSPPSFPPQRCCFQRT